MTAKAISALTPEVTGGVWASIEGCRWLALSKGHFFRLRDFYAAAQLFFDVLESFVTAQYSTGSLQSESCKPFSVHT